MSKTSKLALIVLSCLATADCDRPAVRREVRRTGTQVWEDPARRYSLCPSSVPVAQCGAVGAEVQYQDKSGRSLLAAGDAGQMGRRSAEDVDRGRTSAGDVDRMAGVAGPAGAPNAHAENAAGFARGLGPGAPSRGRASMEVEPTDELLVVVKEEEPEPWRPEEAECGPVDDVERPKQGTLRGRKGDGSDAGEFPLRYTEVSAEVSGFIARTVVEQQYTNPFDRVIEAVYVFPLPAMSAVNDFVMEVRERRIVGLIRPREEAERIYAEARARGQTASLLTQERPNIFTQSVANIEPGGEVKIRITYFQRLLYEDGHYEYVFPMVVGPRYIPGTPVEEGSSASASATTTTTTTTSTSTSARGGGWSPPTDRVTDAERITPPVLRPGQRSGHDIGVTVKLDAGMPITDLVTVTHCVDVEDYDMTRRVVKLSPRDSIPNRDFVLRWAVAGDDLQAATLAHRSDAGGFVTLLVQPPLHPSDAQVMPREITFLLDVSGSMQGIPLDISKDIVARSLDSLRPDDKFNIFYFASGNGQLWDEPRSRDADNLREARGFLDDLSGGGGTEMLAGIRRALRGEHDRRRLQMFAFFTDGYVGDEDDILRLVRDERGEARFFAFGIGSSVNRYLIDGIGQFGNGASHVVLPRDENHAARAAERLFDLIDSPVLVDVTIDWNGLPVEDAYPAKLRDLFAGQTIAVVARYTGAAQGTAYVKGRIGDRTVQVPVPIVLPEQEPANEALAPIWARWKIADLSDAMLSPGAGEQLKRQITDLALEFRLVSQFTAFVAVDESRTVGDGRPLRVMQPVEMPEGVSYEGVFGEQPVGQAGATLDPGGEVPLPAP